MSDLETLPEGWSLATLGDIALWSSGGTPSRSNPSYYTGTIPWIKTGELGQRFVFETEEHISIEAINNSSAKVFPVHSVALAMYGATIGKVSVLGIDAATNQACAVGIPDAVSHLFLYYYLLSQTKNFIDAGKGGAQPNISQSVVKDWPLLVPPKNEQTRIVEKLEELLSDLDNGVAELKTAQTKLTQYRQSLLKSAVEGSLTAEWRKQNPVTETGEQLLQRILIERRQRWEQQKLAEFKEKGKTPPKDWKKKYPEPVKPDTNELSGLPEGWVWASISQVSSDQPYSLAIGPFGSNLKVSDYTDSGVPLVFVRNIRSGNYGGDFTKFVSQEKASELTAHSISPGDVLITKMGEPPGDADVFPSNQPDSIITADCIKVRCWPCLILPEFLKSAINSSVGKQQILPITKGVAQKKVSLGRFASLAVPIPPFEEQKEIISRVLKKQDEVTRELQAALLGIKQAEAQRKNILKSAFSGQLVPQNPNDEPASVLLEKIKAERAIQNKQQPARRKKKAALS